MAEKNVIIPYTNQLIPKSCWREIDASPLAQVSLADDRGDFWDLRDTLKW